MKKAVITKKVIAAFYYFIKVMEVVSVQSRMNVMVAIQELLLRYLELLL